MQTLPPQFWSGFLWMMSNVLKRMNNQFSDYYFSGFREFIENWCDFSTKITITRKIKIGKIWNFIFHSIQPSPHLSLIFEHFWVKKFNVWNIFEEKNSIFFLVGGLIGGFFLGLVDPSRNKFASTAYFAIVCSVFCNAYIHAYIKIK